MPQFYLDIADDERVFTDDVGSVHPDAEEARLELMNTVAERARDLIRDNIIRDVRGTLSDTDRRVLFEITVSVKTDWV